MKNFLKRFLLLLGVFVLSVAGTSLLLNSETTDDRSDMNDPVLPEIMVRYGNELANLMYGYRIRMQADFTRDSVTPLDSSKTLELVINPYDTGVDSLSYEIRTSDGNIVLENRKIKNLGKEDNFLTAKIQVESSLRLSQEYSLQITLDTQVGEVYYYTRVVSRSRLNVEQYVNFARSFYEKCMDKTTSEDLINYMEPEGSNLTTNYANISIHSSMAQVSWGLMKPKLVRKGIPVIKDINETTASISVEYQISAKDDLGNTDYHNVTDFYRMRYTDTRIMLLDFYRSANQIFFPDKGNITDEGLLLGIRQRDVTYMLNDEISVVAFVQEGDLWSYEPDDGKMVRIFSFRRDAGSDSRDNRVEHDIKIIRVSNEGDVDFVLSGYMNRGPHEGLSGICAYHYNRDQNVVEEKVFIPSTESFEFLQNDLGILSYVSPANQLFLLFAKKLYQVDIDQGEYKVLEGAISPETFVVSDTSSHAAWLVGEGEDAGKIKMIDFDKETTRLLEPAEGEELCVIGFMNEDLIYGKVRKEDILTDLDSHVKAGMYVMQIEDYEGNVKKTYSQQGLFIMDPVIRGTLMEFSLAAKGRESYIFVRKDNIMNNTKAAANQVSVEMTSISRMGMQVRLTFEEAPKAELPLVVYAKMRSTDAETYIALDTEIPEENAYYVYALGGLDSIYMDPAKAIIRADETVGVVLNRNQQYIWERGNRKERIQLSLEDVPRIFQTGVWDRQALSDGLGDQGTLIDLSGCTLDQILYELSAQRAVVAKVSRTASVVIVGYDPYNTYIYYPDTGETKPMGIDDSTELFASAGNVFMTFIEPVTY